MATPDAILQIGLNLPDSELSRLQTKMNAISRGFNLNLPFGTLSRDVGTFGRSLDNANQRVIAFASSITILGATIRVFRDIVRSTVEVEKALVEINSVFGLTSRSLDTFSRDLFEVAKDTAQSFQKTAEAAREFSRQGLSAGETLKRTRDAMILTRLASIDTTESVETLTAAVNSFYKAGVNTSDILNKLATVDAAFAVSAKDLAQGLARAGAAAADAGVGLDQLIGLITSAQQTTARGGAVIGNALKTIFARIDKRDTIDAFDSLGIVVRNTEGVMLPALQRVINFAKAYDGLSESARKQAAEMAGGIYQINILKALLGDLERANSVYEQSTRTSTDATNQAIERNKALNQSLGSLLEQLKTVATEAGSNIGAQSIGSRFKGLVGFLIDNPVTKALQDATGNAETTGGKLAEGILKGMGNVLIFGAGPIIARALLNLFANVFGKLFGDIRELAGIGKVAKENEAIQLQINALYKAGGSQLQQQLAAMTSLTERAAALQSILRQTQATGVAQASEVSQLAAIMQTRGYRVRPPRAASGYIPLGEEAAAVARGVGGAPSTARPIYLPSFNRGDGGRGIVANSSEWVVPGAAGGAIFNREMIQRYGLPPGATPVAAQGHIPTAAFGSYLGLPATYGVPAYPLAGATAFGIPPGTPYGPGGVPIAGGAAGQGFGQFLGGIPPQVPTTIEKLVSLINTIGKTSVARNAEDLTKNVRAMALVMSEITRPSYSMTPIVTGVERVSDERLTAFFQNAAASGRGWRNFNEQGLPIGGGVGGRPFIFSTLQQAETLAASRRASSAINRQILLNVANQQVEAGAYNQLTPGAQQLYINELRRQAATNLGFDQTTAYFNPAARSQVLAAVAPQVAALRNQGRALPAAPSLSLGERVRLGLNSPTTRLTVGFGLPLAAGFVPEGQGGTPAGVLGGAASGALNAGGLGFSLLGPYGGAIGAALGGLIGGASKLTKSFEEVAFEVDQKGKKLGEELNNTLEVFRIEDQIKAIRTTGGPRAAEKIIALRQAQLQATARLNNPANRAIALSRRGDPDAPADVSTLNTIETQKQITGGNFINTVRGLQGRFFNLFRENLEGNELDSFSQQIVPLLSKLSPKELQYFRILVQMNPQQALNLLGALGGLDAKEQAQINESIERVGVPDFFATQNKQLGVFQELFSESGSGGIAGDVINKFIFETINENTKAIFTQALLEAAKKAKPLVDKAEQEEQGGGISEFSIPQILGLAGRFQRQAIFRPIRANAFQQIEEARQRIALENPFLTDIDKLTQTGIFNRANITNQFSTRRDSELNAGRAALALLLESKGVRDQRAFNAIEDLRGPGDIERLRKQIVVNEAPGFATVAKDDVLKKLTEMIDSLRVLEATERANIKVNDDIIKLQVEELRFRKTYQGARQEYSGASLNAGVNLISALRRNDVPDILLQRIVAANNANIENDFNAGKIDSNAYYGQKLGVSANAAAAQRLNDASAVKYLLRNPDVRGASDLTGQQISAGLFIDAQNLGQQGKSVESLTGGFRSVFAGLKRDIQDLSAVGQQLGETLHRSLGDAFGDFVTGARSGKDAFRSFAISVLGDAARLFASKAIQGILSSIPGFSANGGAIGFAGGGMVPSMLTGGEIVLSPAAARRIGYGNLNRINRQGYAGGGVAVVGGGSGVMDDVRASLPTGSFVVRKNIAERLGPGYFSALANGGIQNRFLGGFLGLPALIGALVGGGLGYATGGKKGAIGGALLGGIGGGLYGMHSASAARTINVGGSTTTYPGSPISLSIGEKIALYGGAAAGLGLLAAGAAGSSKQSGAISLAQVPAFKAQLEREQTAEMAGKTAYLQLNPQGGYSLGSYGSPYPTRRWAEGGGVDTPMTVSPSSSSSAPQVMIKIDINNNGQVSSSSTQGGNGLPEGAGTRLEQVVRGWVQEEFVKADRPDGYFSQRSRFVNNGF